MVTKKNQQYYWTKPLKIYGWKMIHSLLGGLLVSGRVHVNLQPLKAALPLYVSANMQRDKVAGALANRVRSKSQAQWRPTEFPFADDISVQIIR